MDTARQNALIAGLDHIGASRLDLKRVREPGRTLLNGHRRIFNALETLFMDEVPVPAGCEPISFLFLNQPDLNACAFRSGNFRFIGINWGAIVLFHDLFYRMMACPAVLPHIGNAAGEQAPEKHPGFITSADQLPRFPDMPFGITAEPRDPARAAYAQHLARIALDFLYTHEHQHAAAGHLSFEPGLENSSIKEVRDAPWVGDVLTRHVLEFDADACAANFTLNHVLGRIEPVWAVSDIAEPYLRTDQQRAAAWLFALQTVFLLMDQAGGSGPSGMSHPSPYTMRGFLLACVFAMTGIHHEGPGPAFDMTGEVFGEVDQALSETVVRTGEKRIVTEHLGRNRNAHMALVFQRWKEMYPQLVTLANANGAITTPPPVISFFTTA